MQNSSINRYLLSVYTESFLKVFKHFDLLRVWSLGVGLKYTTLNLTLFTQNYFGIKAQF